MYKSLMITEKGKEDLEVKVLEEEDRVAKDLIDNQKCPECEGEVQMRGHYNAGQHTLHECADCSQFFAR